MPNATPAELDTLPWKLISSPWNCMSDRPRVGYPYRAAALYAGTVTNPNGVPFDVRVLTNRTKTRWWLEAAHDHWLIQYRTTASIKRRDYWLSVLKGGDAIRAE